MSKDIARLFPSFYIRSEWPQDPVILREDVLSMRAMIQRALQEKAHHPLLRGLMETYSITQSFTAWQLRGRDELRPHQSPWFWPDNAALRWVLQAPADLERRELPWLSDVPRNDTLHAFVADRFAGAMILRPELPAFLETFAEVSHLARKALSEMDLDEPCHRLLARELQEFLATSPEVPLDNKPRRQERGRPAWGMFEYVEWMEPHYDRFFAAARAEKARLLREIAGEVTVLTMAAFLTDKPRDAFLKAQYNIMATSACQYLLVFGLLGRWDVVERTSDAAEVSYVCQLLSQEDIQEYASLVGRIHFNTRYVMHEFGVSEATAARKLMVEGPYAMQRAFLERVQSVLLTCPQCLECANQYRASLNRGRQRLIERGLIIPY